jgi:hypothetical protein
MNPRRVLNSFSRAGRRPPWSYLQTGTLPRLISFVCHSYANFASRTVLRDENTGVTSFKPKSFSFLADGGMVYVPIFEPSNVSTFKLSNIQTISRPIPFLSTLLRTLLRSRKIQLFYFQSIPHSLRKTTGGGGRCILQAKSFSPSSRRSFSSLFTLSTESVSQLLCRQSVPHSFQELPVLHQQFPYWNSPPQSYVPPPRSGHYVHKGVIRAARNLRSAL